MDWPRHQTVAADECSAAAGAPDHGLGDGDHPRRRIIPDSFSMEEALRIENATEEEKQATGGGMAMLACMITDILASADQKLAFALVVYDPADPEKINFIGSDAGRAVELQAAKQLVQRLEAGEPQKVNVTTVRLDQNPCDCPACTANRANGISSGAVH